MKKSAIVVLFLVLTFFVGPRVAVDTTITPVELTTGTAVEYIRQNEAAVEGLRPGTEKEVVWAGRAGRRTPISIVYIHGFSATKEEIRPVPDLVARQIGANIFYTRLTGHGVPGWKLGSVQVQDWVNDVTEAIAVGEAIGERVILMGTSTGGTLAAWAATEPELAENLAAVVLVSPNFGPDDKRADMLLWPWGRQILHAVQGDTFRWDPENDNHDRFWTRAYPTDALLPMMATVRMARKADLESLQIPVFVAWSPGDRVVDPSRTVEAISRLDSVRVDTMVVLDSQDRNQHVIAGDILSPNTTDKVVGRIVAFIRGVN